MNASPSILEWIGNTPLARLDRLASHIAVPIRGKCEFLNPGGNGKDRIALLTVDDAERYNLIRRGSTLIKATAGNTNMDLALVAAARGYRLGCVMPSVCDPGRSTWPRG